MRPRRQPDRRRRASGGPSARSLSRRNRTGPATEWCDTGMVETCPPPGDGAKGVAAVRGYRREPDRDAGGPARRTARGSVPALRTRRAASLRPATPGREGAPAIACCAIAGGSCASHGHRRRARRTRRPGAARRRGGRTHRARGGLGADAPAANRGCAPSPGRRATPGTRSRRKSRRGTGCDAGGAAAPPGAAPRLPLERLGFGPGMSVRLNQLGIHDTADLAAAMPRQPARGPRRDQPAGRRRCLESPMRAH